MWMWILTVWIQLQFVFFVASVDTKNDTVLAKNRHEIQNYVTKRSFAISKLNKTDQDDLKDASYRKNHIENENIMKEMDLFLYNKSRSRLSITPYHDEEIKRRYAIEKYVKEDDVVKYNDTKENGVKFESIEHESARKSNLKMEKFSLGKVHFSSEVLLNYDVNKNTKSERTTAFNKYFSPKSDFLRQKYDVLELDYKMPEDEYASRKTTPIDEILTSVDPVIFTTRTSPQTSTTMSFRRDFHQERILMKMGPFTFFIYKVMEFLAAKRPSQWTKEITDEFRGASLKLYAERPNLYEFGEPFNRGVKEFFTNIRGYEGDTLQRMAAIFHKALPKRWELFSVLVNVLYERIDALYLPREVDRMYELLLDLKNYPHVGKNATDLVTTILVDAIVDPFTREGISERRFKMLQKLNSYVSVTYYNGQHRHVPGEDGNPLWAPRNYTQNPDLPPQLWRNRTTYTPLQVPDYYTHLTKSVYAAGGIPNLDTKSNPTFEVLLVTTTVKAKDTPRSETKRIPTIDAKDTTTSKEKVIPRFKGNLAKSTIFGAKATTRSEGNRTQNLEVKTKPVGRSATKNGHKQARNISDQEWTLYNDSQAENSLDIELDDILSPNNHHVSVQPKNSYEHPGLFDNSKKYESAAVKTTGNLKEKLIKSRQKLFKEKSPLPIHKENELQSDGNLNREEEEELNFFLNNFKKNTSPRKPINLGKMWKEVIETNNDSDKNMNGDGHLSREQRFVNKTVLRQKLHSEELKRKLISNHRENINDATLEETTTETLPNPIIHKENKNYVSIDKTTTTTTTDSFLDLLLKLDGLVNSGEGGLLDEIMKEKDVAVQKIDSDNEKFLEKEAAEKLFNSEKSQMHSMTKKYMQKDSKNTRKGKSKEYGEVLVTKRYITSANNGFRDRQRSTMPSTIDGHIKHALREQKNNNSANTPARVEETDPSEKTLSITTRHYINITKTTSLRNKVKHKNKNLSKASSRAQTKRKKFPQTPKSDISRDQSREWPESHKSRTSRKPAQKYETFLLTFRKPSRQIKDYTTKKSVGQFTKDNAVKKSIKELTIDHTRTTRTSLKKIKKGYTLKKVKNLTKYHTVKESLQKPKNIFFPEKNKNNEKINTDKDVNIEIMFQNTKSHPHTIKYKKNKEETYYDANDILRDKLKKSLHENVNSIREGLTTNDALRYRPPERINKKFQQQKEEQRKEEERKERKRKRKHFKYTPTERFVRKDKQNSKGRSKKKINKQQEHSRERSSYGDDYNTTPEKRLLRKGKQSNNAHSKKKINNQQRQSYESSSYEAGDKNTNADTNISGDSDNDAVWNVTNSMEKKVQFISDDDDYYYLQGQGKIIFKDDLGKTFELKKSKTEPNIGRNKHISKYNKMHAHNGGKTDVSDKRDKTDFFIVEKKEKHIIRDRKTKNFRQKKGRSNFRQLHRPKKTAKDSETDSTEITELLGNVSDIDELLEDHSVKVDFKHKQQYPDDDEFDDPINEYTLKPKLKSYTENEVFTVTTLGIFEELKQMKNRLFNQNFRRGMNRRKNKITLNELFFKKRSHVKKIIEESSYSDDENDLKAKLQEALRQNSTTVNQTENTI